MPWWNRSTAWNKMSTPKRAIAGTGSVVGALFIYLILFWFILRFFWRHVIARRCSPGQTGAILDREAPYSSEESRCP